MPGRSGLPGGVAGLRVGAGKLKRRSEVRGPEEALPRQPTPGSARVRGGGSAVKAPLLGGGNRVKGDIVPCCPQRGGPSGAGLPAACVTRSWRS